MLSDVSGNPPIICSSVCASAPGVTSFTADCQTTCTKFHEVECTYHILHRRHLTPKLPGELGGVQEYVEICECRSGGMGSCIAHRHIPISCSKYRASMFGSFVASLVVICWVRQPCQRAPASVRVHTYDRPTRECMVRPVVPADIPLALRVLRHDYQNTVRRFHHARSLIKYLLGHRNPEANMISQPGPG